MPEAVIVATARSPIGRANKGSLREVRPDDLAADMVRTALAQVPQLDPSTIDEAAFASRLYTADCPDPDLLIRTSGEQRISNFLLWQLAYSELFLSPVLWPDFTRRELFGAIRDFQLRERRFGRILA